MLSIGEFSRLSRVSPRMLRYYDAMGLLRPAHIGAENGYRYYDEGQLARLTRIRRLQEYGFPLSEIGALLTLDEGALAERIHCRRLCAYGEINALRERLRRMEADIARMEGIGMLQDKYHVITLEDPGQRVFSIRRTIDIGQVHGLFQDLRQEAAKRGLAQAGPTQLLYHGQEFSYDHMDAEAQMVVSGQRPDVAETPARTCAAVIHQGPYEEIHHAYDALCAWLGEHPEYKVCGPAVERYLKDEGAVRSPEELETGVLFPVELVTA